MKPASFQPLEALQKICVSHDRPPIPLRTKDWSAWFDNYEPGDPIGYGASEQAAIDDLLMQTEPV